MKFKAFAIALLGLAAMQGQAAIIFSDDFQDGDTVGWSHTTNAPANRGTNGIESSLWGGGDTGVEELDGVDRSLRTFVRLPNDGSLDVTGLYSRATTSFTVDTAGDIYLGLEARSRNCSGCTMFYEVFLNGNLLASAGAVLDFQDLDFIENLDAGVHELTLGMYSDVANNGYFQAFFDDVCITTAGEDCFAPVQVPEPGTLGLLMLGLGALTLTRKRRATYSQ